MNRFITAALIPSFVFIQPVNASETLVTIEHSENPAQIIQQILCSSGTFNVKEARRLLFQLKQEVKAQHGIDLDLDDVIAEATRILIQTGQFSEAEIATAREFYSQLIKPEMRVCNKHKSGKKHKDKKKHKKAKGHEVMLPDKMALGFVFILSGALLCVIPLGITQGIGTSLIGTGIYSVADGVREGERPYYVDSETGERLN